MSCNDVKRKVLSLKSFEERVRIVVPPSDKERVIDAMVIWPRKKIRFLFLAEREVLIDRVPRVASADPAPEEKEHCDAR